MGATQSTQSVTDTIARDVTNTIIQTGQNCGGEVKQNQSVSQTGNGNVMNGNSLTQTAAVNFSCLSDSTTLSTLQSNITNAITQNLQQSGPALLPGGTIALQTAVKSDVEKNFTASNISSCFLAMTQAQSLAQTGDNNTALNNTLAQAQTASMSCVQNTLNQCSAVTSATATLDNKTSNEATMPSLFGGLFDSLGNIAAIIGGIIFLIIVLIAIKMFSGGGGPTYGYAEDVLEHDGETEQNQRDK